jgi:hypothetical protein
MERKNLILKYPLGMGDHNHTIEQEINESLKVANHPGVSDIKVDYNNQLYIVTIPDTSKGIFSMVKEVLKYHNIRSYEIEFN